MGLQALTSIQSATNDPEGLPARKMLLVPILAKRVGNQDRELFGVT